MLCLTNIHVGLMYRNTIMWQTCTKKKKENQEWGKHFVTVELLMPTQKQEREFTPFICDWYCRHSMLFLLWQIALPCVSFHHSSSLHNSFVSLLWAPAAAFLLISETGNNSLTLFIATPVVCQVIFLKTMTIHTQWARHNVLALTWWSVWTRTTNLWLCRVKDPPKPLSKEQASPHGFMKEVHL